MSTQKTKAKNVSKAAKKQPSKVAAAVVVAGLSNTQPTTHIYSQLNACFDWLKVRFDGAFSPVDGKGLMILTALRVNHNIFDLSAGASSYANKYVYAENVVILSGGHWTKNAKGEETWLLDMSGQACRDFELRGGSWSELIQAVLVSDGLATRVDLAMDDYSSSITISDLKKKINAKEYTTTTRKLKLEGKAHVILDEDYEPDLITSRNDGFTATFGGRSTKQLCIYNKKAERMSKDIDVFVPSWIRYEARFYHEAAVSVFKEVLSELLDSLAFDSSLGRIVAGLVGGLVEFKEKSSFDNNHLYKAPTWEKWKKLLNDVSKITVRNQAKEELSIAAKHQWIVTYAGPSLMKIFLAYPREFFNLVSYAVISSADNGKVDNSTVAAVNVFRKRFGLPFINLDEARESVETTFGNCRELKPYMIELLRLFNPETGELLLPGSEKSP